MSTQDIVKELEKLDAEEKATEKEKSTDETVETKEEATSKASSEVIKNFNHRFTQLFAIFYIS